MAHARGGAEGSQSCREDADDDLNDGLPSFLLHSAFMLFLGVALRVSAFAAAAGLFGLQEAVHVDELGLLEELP